MENMEMINEVMNEEVTAIAEAIPEVLPNEMGDNAIGKIVFAVGALVVTVVGLTVTIKRRKAKGIKREKRNFIEGALIRWFEKKGFTVMKLDENDEIEDVTVQEIK